MLIPQIKPAKVLGHDYCKYSVLIFFIIQAEAAERVAEYCLLVGLVGLAIYSHLSPAQHLQRLARP